MGHSGLLGMESTRLAGYCRAHQQHTCCYRAWRTHAHLLSLRFLSLSLSLSLSLWSRPRSALRLLRLSRERLRCQLRAGEGLLRWLLRGLAGDLQLSESTSGAGQGKVGTGMQCEPNRQIRSDSAVSSSENGPEQQRHTDCRRLRSQGKHLPVQPCRRTDQCSASGAWGPSSEWPALTTHLAERALERDRSLRERGSSDLSLLNFASRSRSLQAQLKLRPHSMSWVSTQ